MLTPCWFLSASLKWGQEAIDGQSQWFHLVAWGLPAIMTIVVQVPVPTPYLAFLSTFPKIPLSALTTGTQCTALKEHFKSVKGYKGKNMKVVRPTSCSHLLLKCSSYNGRS